MKQTTLLLPEIKLVGIACRTNNAQETTPRAKIGAMVQKYMQDSLATQIQHRKNPGTGYSVFTDYDSDFTGDYTYFIGEEVTSFDPLPRDFEKHTIPAQQYTKFTTLPGVMPTVCIEAWQKIWAMTPTELGGPRNYVADFELYDARAQDPQHTVLDIYIGLRPGAS